MATTQASAILANIVTRIESVTATTALGGRTSFVHVKRAWSEDDLFDLKDPTRKFIVEPGDDTAAGLPLLVQDENMSPRAVTHLVVVSYRQGQDKHALAKIMAEDADQITRELQHVGGSRYDETNTKLWRRRVSGAGNDFDEGSGGVALMRLSVSCDYLPAFT